MDKGWATKFGDKVGVDIPQDSGARQRRSAALSAPAHRNAGCTARLASLRDKPQSRDQKAEFSGSIDYFSARYRPSRRPFL